MEGRSAATSAMTPATALDGDQPRAPRSLAGALAGVLAAAVAIGAAQLAAGLTVPQSSPVLAVGQTAIDLTPLPVKNFAISTFGSDDKIALLGGILVILTLYAAWIGTLAVRRLSSGLWGLAIFAFIGLYAALNRPGSSLVVCPAHAGRRRGRGVRAHPAGARRGPAERPRRPAPRPAPPSGCPAHCLTDRPARSPVLAAGTDPAGPAASPDDPAAPGGPAAPGFSFTFLPNPDDGGPPRGPARRRFLVASGVAAAAAAAGTLAGRELGTQRDVTRARAAAAVAPARRSRAAAARGQQPGHPGSQLVHHPERQLLPGRHRPDPASGRPVDLAAPHPRDGPPRGDHHLRRAAQAPPHRGLRDAHLRVRPGGRPLRGQRQVARRQPDRPDPAGAPARGRGPAAVHLGRRVHLGYPAAGRAGRPGRAARRRDERRGAAGRARLPGPDGDPWPVRLRVRDQVGDRHRGHDVRVGHRLLGLTRLVAAGSDQDRVQGRRARDRRVAPPGTDAGGRGGLGPAQGHRRGRGPGRPRPVARGAAGRGAGHRHLAAVGLGVARHARPPPARGPGHRPVRLHPDRRRRLRRIPTAPPATPQPPSPSAAPESPDPAAGPPAPGLR